MKTFNLKSWPGICSVLILSILSALVVPAAGQATFKAQLRGTVHDSSGAAIQDARSL